MPQVSLRKEQYDEIVRTGEKPTPFAQEAVDKLLGERRKGQGKRKGGRND